MLKTRIIPCLDVADGRVVKGVNFTRLVDAGDPVAAAAAYDAAGADELCFLDIHATHENRGTMFDPSAVFYMDKLVTGPEAADYVDIDAPVHVNIRRVAKAKHGHNEDVTVCILDRPRHAGLVDEVRAAGARIRFISDGDVAGRKPMFWEHEGNAAVRIGKWKLVKRYPRDWELYDMDADRTELHDLAPREPARVEEMAAQYDAWAKRCGVIPRERIVALMSSQGVTRAFWEKDEV